MNLSLARVVFSRRMIVALLMGFSSGLPLLLTVTLLQAWMKQEKVDLSVIGLMSLVGLPYTLKFLWAPILDRFALPLLGRRRGWLLLSQVCLVAAIIALGSTDPAMRPLGVAFAALVVTFMSATQDIVVDAYRREDLPDSELGLGSSFYINGYRVGMLLASGGGLILADHMPFSQVYIFMGLCMLPGIVTTLLTPEPVTGTTPPKTLREAVIDPITDYIKRNKALTILAFILFYKIGDTMASTMTTPFYLDIGFTKSEIGAVVKLFGFWATVCGGFLGGLFMLRIGIKKSLWIFGILQAVSTGGFALLALLGRSLPALSAVIAFENLTGGMGTAAYAAFMASITNKRFTATQYALLSSLMGVPRVIASAPTGIMADHLGWPVFFIFCTVAAAPGLILLMAVGLDSEDKCT
ncbi:MAG: AmpG family muropeptide MFS transporter [Deltaproteobacteria bacterium CG_4_8_14_3_um_filter_51_11]|nr:AmpG family muropeptide MFS transporter [bacterium]OIP40165.1 MAG: AmpG family muropeptide MFS transporter [Desulfobacteraceae bacterium CG2_30_51_40]PIP47415.1 MAG: AmpG family muropeptide MFS transporter [Deltaproteobacteria bacterium CG23_combo_of_CG06-09_8_20_14_all_51_20]PIX18403.1 MAG: AmpG family muropeptide MFS transporter [Deltaproteobacteria bacterium CG_4_8_14_3_um_filter_51_11]PIY25450.1 MAG: AmpG family muropeptide MFS transporter [Deltaproteobacteria bacterium CG_4_10_14_3_um_f